MNRALGVAVAIGGLFVGVSSAEVELDYIRYAAAPTGVSNTAISASNSVGAIPGGRRTSTKRSVLSAKRRREGLRL